MNTRIFANTNIPVSEIGIGTWQLGGTEWGDVSESDALDTLNAAADAGVTFIDTADIYGSGRSESLVAKFLAQHPNPSQFFIATKLGRSASPGWPENFTRQTVRQHTLNSLKRLNVDALDLTQTHCVPHEVMQHGEIFDHLRDLQTEGLIKQFGASVETVDEALTCLEVPGLASLQIIFNIFRQKPIHTIFEKAQQKNVALIIRLPLASGLLAGKYTLDTTFPEADHRNFNRDGDAFNVGETFAGLPFATGVNLANQLKPLIPADPDTSEPVMTLAQFAIRYCLDFPAVTTIIPGARNPAQATANTLPSSLPPLSKETHQHLTDLYQSEIAPQIRGPY